MKHLGLIFSLFIMISCGRQINEYFPYGKPKGDVERITDITCEAYHREPVDSITRYDTLLISKKTFNTEGKFLTQDNIDRYGSITKHVEYEYTDGELSSIKTIFPDGEEWTRSVVSREGNSIIWSNDTKEVHKRNVIIKYNSDGQITRKERYNCRGRLVRREDYDIPENSKSVTSYVYRNGNPVKIVRMDSDDETKHVSVRRYTKKDKHGNWIERIDGENMFYFRIIEYRK